jgi:putative Holliday junction resolvase
LNGETKYLSLDYGLKRIGVSVSDNSKKFAFQRDYYNNNEKFLPSLIELIKSENIIRIIIGRPLRFNSEKTHITDDVDNFSKKLTKELKKYGSDCDVIFFDERLTSSLAQYNLNASGLSKKKRKDKGNIDTISAQIILQDYLDSIKKH